MKSKTMQDVRVMNLSDRRAYVQQALVRAKSIAAEIPDGDSLYAAFEPMLQFVVASEILYAAGCHDTSAVLYMKLRQAGLQEADMALCIGEVNFLGSRFDHSWVEVRGQVFDVAICAPHVSGGFAGGPVFAGEDLTISALAQAKFGVKSTDRLDQAAANVYDMNLSQYLSLQKSHKFKSMDDLAHEVYKIDGQELLTKYGNVSRLWRNPLLNPYEVVV